MYTKEAFESMTSVNEPYKQLQVGHFWR